MQAFHNDPLVKEKYLSRVRAHAAADALIQGTGWDGSKGCAVGCTLEAYDHTLYPVELGLPEWLARLEDSIFEGLPTEQAMTWPQRFLEAIPVGADVDVVRHRLAILRLDRLIALQTESLGKHGFDEMLNQVITSLQVVRRCHEAEAGGTSCDVTFEMAAWSAESAAWSAWSAWSAAESAARSAAWSARSAAESAARSAAWSARSAAWSAWSAWSAARSAAWSAWVQESQDLLKLLSELN